jgi:SAM-dependent methyltransferase
VLERLLNGNVAEVPDSSDPVQNERVMYTEAELDEFIEEARGLTADYPAFLQFVGARRFAYPQPIPPDPLSDAYRAYQVDLWRTVSGRANYDPLVCEAEPELKVEPALRNPWPHLSHDHVTVGNYYLLLGWILRNMNCKPGARIVEFGPGWGHVTDALVRSGYDVTVIDIEQRFLDLIKARSERDGLSLTIHQGSFETLPPPPSPYDVAIFSECFHHSIDHVSLVSQLAKFLQPGGRVLLAGEPIETDFPVPWGLRLDGQSLWATRTMGWMELGFQESYVRDLLESNGFDVSRHDLPGVGISGWLLIGVLR